MLIRLNDRTEAILPREERIVGETYIPGDRLKFYLLDVRQTTRGAEDRGIEDPPGTSEGL